MPRRESYQTDDDDEPVRSGAASGGGGVPAAVWVGGGVAAVVLLAGFALFANRRNDMARDQVARAEFTRMQAATRPQKIAPEPVPFAPNQPPGVELPAVPVAQIATAFRTDAAAAARLYTGNRIRVRFVVKVIGDGWVGTAADLGAGLPRDTAANVVFRLANDSVRVGSTVVIEGRCEGLPPDATAEPLLTFSDGSLVPG